MLPFEETAGVCYTNKRVCGEREWAARADAGAIQGCSLQICNLLLHVNCRGKQKA